MTNKTFPMSDRRDTQPAASALATFVACAQLMLDAATPEDVRRQAETRALAQLPVLRALGMFELFDVRNPALAALLHDELEQLDRKDTASFPARCGQAHARRA